MAWKFAINGDGDLKEEVYTGCRCIILPHELAHEEIIIWYRIK